MPIDVELLDRTLPYNLEAEKAILGAVLLHAEAHPLAASLVSGTDFFRDAHRRVWEAMGALLARGEPVEMVLLKDVLARAGDLDEVGGPAYLAALVDGLPRVANVEHYARLVREKAQLRAVIACANGLVAAAYEAQEPPSALIDTGVSTLLRLATATQGEAVRAGQEAVAWVSSLDQAPGAPEAALPTGYTDLDEMLAGGLRPSELVILAGRPSAGKSSLGLGMARGVALHAVPTVVFSLEMRSRALAARLVSWGARVDRQKLQRGYASEQEYARVGEALSVLDGAPLYLQDTAATLTEVAAWCQRLKAQYGIRVAVVDYLQLMAHEARNQSREAAVAAVSKGLKRLATTQDLAVVALSALNRAPDGRKDPRPRLSDLRESGSIESDADVVLLLYRADQYEKNTEASGTAEVIVAKNREGATGTIRLTFNEHYAGLFENYAPNA